MAQLPDPVERRMRPVRIGYWLTAGWIVVVLAVSGGAPGHPAFDLIFIVPLAGWVALLGSERAWRALAARRDQRRSSVR